MERFAFKIDKTLRANLYKICRLCGIDNPDKVNILGAEDEIINADDCEPALWRKIEVCIGFTVTKDDKMPQAMCSLCVDKINDFFEFREMCFATNTQTRKLLGLKEEKPKIPPTPQPPVVAIKEDVDIKQPLANQLGKRAVFGKGKRKRKAEEMLEKPIIKEDIEEVKQEKPSTSSSVSSTPIRKKSKLSAPATVPSATASSSSVAAPVAASATVPAKKKNKPLTPMQRRAVEQAKLKADKLLKAEKQLKEDKISKAEKVLKAEKLLKAEKVLKAEKLKPKEEIKDEVIEVKPTTSAAPPTAPVPVPPKFNSKFKHSCNICNQRFVSKIQLEKHLYATHVPTVPRYYCLACNETMKKGNEIKNHQLWHKLSKTPFICGLCDEQLLTSYAFARHLKDHTSEIPTALLVLDRQCPQCQQTFATNFLYNTHACSIKTKKCAGCSRHLKNEADYLKHAALCSKIYINYSKHISAAAVAAESFVRIKNENEVEAAAAAELLARNSGTSLDMTPVVSLTRLSTPALMPSNQCVLIPGQKISEEAQMSPSTSSAKSSKKGNKKGVSRKDLKRVDDLLKSTMDTLVSIKHEPEVHMDTCDVTTELSSATPTATASIEDATMEEEEHSAHSPLPEGDFRDDDSYHGDDNNDTLPAVNTNVHIKTELLDETEKEEQSAELGGQPDANIKQEAAVEEEANPNKVPVLKLKITKEHGKLNTSIVQNDEHARGEKKKKKKKRKDTDKEKDKIESNAVQGQEIEHDNSVLMPQPGIVHIKQERLDDDEAAALFSATPHLNLDGQPASAALIMTTIPQAISPPMEFQISCISSGVEFDTGEQAFVEQAADSITHDTDADVDCEDIEMQDVKPCRETLDRLMQITNVSGGVEMALGEDLSGELQENTSINHHVNAPVKHKKPQLKPRKTNRKAVKSTGGVTRNPCALPQIVAVTSGNDVDATFDAEQEPELQPPVVIKKERFDVGYGDVYTEPDVADDNYTEDSSTNTIPPHDPSWRSSSPASEVSHFSETSVQKLSDEQAYIASIDFNNIVIKQEKEIEVSEVELNESLPINEMLSNGLTAKNRHKKPRTERRSIGEEYYDNVDMEEDYETDEEEEEDEEDYDELEDDEEVEEREYRELELPPMLEEKDNDETNTITQIEETNNEPKLENVGSLEPSPMMIVISNVVSEAAASTPLLDEESVGELIQISEPEINEENEAENTAAFEIQPLQFKIMSVISEIGQTSQPSESFVGNIENSAITEPATVIESLTQTSEMGLMAQPFIEPLATNPEATISDSSTQDPNTHMTAQLLSESLASNQAATISESATEDPDIHMREQTFTESLATNQTATISGDLSQDLDIHMKVQPLCENNQTATISGSITQAAEVNLMAQPIFEPPLATNAQNESNAAETIVCERLDTSEELQNQLNHEMSDQASILDITQSSSIDNMQTMPEPLEEHSPTLDEPSTSLSCCYSSPLIEIPTTSSQAAPKLNEETENLINESNDAAGRFHTNDSLLRQQQPMLHNNNLLLLNDDSNINEIAENNNNANIERELQDDSFSTTFFNREREVQVPLEERGDHGDIT